jgi:membrane protein required for colicin V production
MHWVDILIIGIVVLSAVISLVRGFIQEAFSLATWIAAFWLAWFAFRPLSVHLAPWINEEHIRLPGVDIEQIQMGLAFVAILIVVLIVGAIINHFLKHLVTSTGLSGTDRMLGIFFGAGRGILVVGILVLLAGFTAFPKAGWWGESQLIPLFQELVVWLKENLPPEIADKFSY